MLVAEHRQHGLLDTAGQGCIGSHNLCLESVLPQSGQAQTSLTLCFRHTSTTPTSHASRKYGTFGRDFSKLENWRMMFFGSFAYKPANDWSLSGASAPLHRSP